MLTVATANEVPRRVALRYHGGKWKLADWIVSNFPSHRVYVEPFCGAASVLLRKPRSYAEVINDLDDDVVSLFRVLRNPSTALVLREALEMTPFARREYEQAREVSSDPVERARRLIIRSFMGFGSNAHNPARVSGFRANSNRSGTTPSHDWANYSNALPDFTARLRGVVIENRDACECMVQHDSPKTLHYVDPPYVRSTRSQLMRSPGCYVHEMDDDGHRALAQCLSGLSGMVVLSGYPSELYDDELFSGWARIERASLADGARERTEVLWLNDAAAAATGDGPLFEHQLKPEMGDG